CGQSLQSSYFLEPCVRDLGAPEVEVDQPLESGQLLYPHVRHFRPGEGEGGQLLKLDDLLEARVRHLRVVEGEPVQLLEPYEVFEIRIRPPVAEQYSLSHRLASLGFIPKDLAAKSLHHRQCLLLSIIRAGGRGGRDNKERDRE